MKRAIVGALVVGALLATGASAGAARTTTATTTVPATAHTTVEPYAQLQTQIAGHQVRSARINRKAHRVTVVLTSGERRAVSYPSREEPQLVKSLRASGATVHVRHARARHHAASHTSRLRYVLGFLLLVAVAIGSFFLGRRTRPSRPAGDTASPPVAASAPPAAGGPPPAPTGEAALPPPD